MQKLKCGRSGAGDNGLAPSNPDLSSVDFSFSQGLEEINLGQVDSYENPAIAG
jgi:hypothetical protein